MFSSVKLSSKKVLTVVVLQGQDSRVILVVLCEKNCFPNYEHAVEGLVLDASNRLGPARRKMRTSQVKEKGG